MPQPVQVDLTGDGSVDQYSFFLVGEFSTCVLEITPGDLSGVFAGQHYDVILPPEPATEAGFCPDYVDVTKARSDGSSEIVYDYRESIGENLITIVRDETSFQAQVTSGTLYPSDISIVDPFVTRSQVDYQDRGWGYAPTGSMNYRIDGVAAGPYRLTVGEEYSYTNPEVPRLPPAVIMSLSPFLATACCFRAAHRTPTQSWRPVRS